jgi:NAD(P)-dependent dehydrogenase (short-subunit alcohol dehydrogenase family)
MTQETGGGWEALDVWLGSFLESGSLAVDLANKTIIISGASSGIGAAAASLFASEGADVVLGARRHTELQNVAESIKAAGGRATFLAGDARDTGYAAALVEHAVKTFGKLDGAFNNAGIVGDMTSVPEMSVENWALVLAVNLTSAFLSARAQIPALRAQGGGSIVFTSSFVGFANGGMPGMAAYAASKAGLIGFTQSLGSEHAAEGIRVNALLPGGTITPAAGEGNPDLLNLIAGFHPMKRMANPKEIAQAALFLLSDRARSTDVPSIRTARGVPKKCPRSSSTRGIVAPI